MAMVTFVGDARGHGPVVMIAFGCVLPKGEPIEVTSERALAKFRRNDHYEVEEAAAVGYAPEAPAPAYPPPPAAQKKPRKPRKAKPAEPELPEGGEVIPVAE